jgi:hypothetical protein
VTEPAPPRPEHDHDDGHGHVPGRAIIRASWIGTAAFTAAAVAGAASEGLMPVTVVVSIVLFAIGVVAFLAAYARAVGRSRYEAIGMGGLFFLAGSAPRSVQVQLMASLAIEVVVALTVSSVRIYTAVAFSILAPMFGIGLAGLWGALHGRFPPRASSAEVG